MLTICDADLLASIFISFVFLGCATAIVANIVDDVQSYNTQEVFASWFLSRSSLTEDDEAIVAFFSIIIAMTIIGTVVTSLWTALTTFSCVLIRVISSINPLLRLLRWMFDVEAHPVGVLGRAAACLVWVSSFALTRFLTP